MSPFMNNNLSGNFTLLKWEAKNTYLLMPDHIYVLVMMSTSSKKEDFFAKERCFFS